MRVRLAFALLSFIILAAPRAMGQCAMIQVQMAYIVTTEWWDGTTTWHWQFGWFDVYSCGIDVNGGGPGGGGPGGGGPGGSDGPTPPTLEIRDISDANPQQPLLRISENDAVVETTLS